MADLGSAKRTEPEVVFLQLSGFLRPVLILGALICLSLYFNRASWEHLNGWEYLGFGLLPVTFLVLFLLRKRMFLKLDDEGLTVHYVTGTERKFAWTDITKVGIVSFKRPTPSVVLRLRDDSPALSTQTRIYRAATGYDVTLSPFFGPAKTLAARIEEIRLNKGAPVH